MGGGGGGGWGLLLLFFFFGGGGGVGGVRPSFFLQENQGGFQQFETQGQSESKFFVGLFLITI